MNAPVSVAIPGYLTGTWMADPARSEITFCVHQLMVSKVRGRFTGYDVTIVTGDDPLGSSVAATIELASLDTGNARRDHHLCSAAYLDAGKEPTATYRSTGVRLTNDGWIVDGELTLHGVTRPVPMALTVNGFGTDPDGAERVGFSATAQLDRREFGVDVGGVMVGDRVTIGLEMLAVREK